MSSLPPELDFTADPSATPARMDTAMLFILAYLRRLEALQPELLSVIADLRATGLSRLDTVLSPIFVDAQEIEAQLTAIRAAWITGQPLAQLLADLRDQVTARLGNVDAQLLANLDAVTQRLAANADTVAAQLAANLAAVNAKLAPLVFGTTQGKIPQIGAGDMLDPALIPRIVANQNIAPNYADWRSASFSLGTSMSNPRYGASGWGLVLTRSAAQPVPVISTGYRIWPKSTDLAFSFYAWTNGGVATLMCDLYPDDLPEQYFVLSPTPMLCTFVVNSALANMDSAAMRFFVYAGDGEVTANVTDIKVEYGRRSTAWTRADASPADFLAGVADRVLGVDAVWKSVLPVVFVDAPSMTINLSVLINAATTLTGNRTFTNPVGLKAGQSGYIVFTQDGTGGRTLAFGTAWRFGAQVPTMSTAPNARDILYYTVMNDGTVDAYLSKGR